MPDVASTIQAIGVSDCLALGVDPHSGDLAEWRAWSQGRMESLTQEMGLTCGRKVSSDSLVSEEPLAYMDLYDARQEKLGWYRIARAAEICHIDPEWLSFAVECDMVKSSHGYGRGGECQRVRVKLADVRAWIAMR